jgi:hypothetical protein
VRMPDPDDVLRLRHVEPHKESLPIRPQGGLHLPEYTSRNRLTRVALSCIVGMGFFLLCAG